MTSQQNSNEGGEEYIVKIYPNTDIEEIASLCGFEIKKQLRLGKKKNYYLLKKSSNMEQDMDKLNSLVEYIEENKVVKYYKKKKNF
ncbi:hypothetical protein M0813_28762 [Anaeramoeba flamelloides]|uniref:Uncharacterized protein n=1 Tax=Anaeramoeba flamelloides TaxID=1746091 RepID=A0ABQ8XSJ0_9EUKA|nr:hypothetical protein M0813_28762 [Anaeramoeba flamelloides]